MNHILVPAALTTLILGGVRHRREPGALELRRGGTSEAGALGVLVRRLHAHHWPVRYRFDAKVRPGLQGIVYEQHVGIHAGT